MPDQADASGAVSQTRRRIAAKWVEKLFRTLTPDELDLITRALGTLPLEPSVGTVEELLARARRGEVQLYILPGNETSAFAAISFFKVVTLSDGSKQFTSLCTVGAADYRLVPMDIPFMEQLARDLGCNCMEMETIRPGLVKQLSEKHGWYPSSITVRKILS